MICALVELVEDSRVLLHDWWTVTSQLMLEERCSVDSGLQKLDVVGVLHADVDGLHSFADTSLS